VRENGGIDERPSRRPERVADLRLRRHARLLSTLVNLVPAG
jgi:hypothetical protein